MRPVNRENTRAEYYKTKGNVGKALVLKKTDLRKADEGIWKGTYQSRRSRQVVCCPSETSAAEPGEGENCFVPSRADWAGDAPTGLGA